MHAPKRKYGESDESYAERVAESKVWRKRLIIGYAISGVVFLLAMFVFIIAIMVGSGAAGGIGGVLLAVSIVDVISTAIYHHLTMDEYT